MLSRSHRRASSPSASLATNIPTHASAPAGVSTTHPGRISGEGGDGPGRLSSSASSLSSIDIYDVKGNFASITIGPGGLGSLITQSARRALLSTTWNS